MGLRGLGVQGLGVYGFWIWVSRLGPRVLRTQVLGSSSHIFRLYLEGFPWCFQKFLRSPKSSLGFGVQGGKRFGVQGFGLRLWCAGFGIRWFGAFWCGCVRFTHYRVGVQDQGLGASVGRPVGFSVKVR